jgi:hypothetical protein
MTDLADLLRPLLDRASPPPLTELQARVARRRRRRRLRIGVAATAVTAALVVIATSLTGGSARPVTKVHVGQHPPVGSVSSISLPATSSEGFSTIATTSGGLLLTGALQTVGSTPLCDYSSLDPETLQLGQVHTSDCDDPAAFGQTISLVSGPEYNSNPGPSATARIARLDARTGQVSDGPVIFTYLDASDTRPLSAYADGWMWVYDVATNHGSEVLQVSSTGRVVDTIAMPQMFRPILAANDAGLWLGDSLDGYGSGIDTLYRVAPGSRAPVVVVAGSRVVTWLQADSGHLWAGVASVPVTSQTIWRFDGSKSTPAFTAPLPGTDSTVIGDASQGLWTVRWRSPSPARSPAPEPQQVLQINPSTGRHSIMTTLPPLPASYTTGLSQGQAAVLDGYIYILEPPYRPGMAYPELIRVAAPGP